MSTPDTVHAATPVATIRRLRAMHYARVDSAVALQRAGLYDSAVGDLGDALDELGIRPPDRHVDQLRRRFPGLYGLADNSRDTGDDRDLLRRMHAAALRDYAIDLVATADAIADLEVDPLGAAERLADTEGLTVPLGVYAADLLEQYRDAYDELVGASFTATHSPA